MLGDYTNTDVRVAGECVLSAWQAGWHPPHALLDTVVVLTSQLRLRPLAHCCAPGRAAPGVPDSLMRFAVRSAPNDLASGSGMAMAAGADTICTTAACDSYSTLYMTLHSPWPMAQPSSQTNGGHSVLHSALGCMLPAQQGFCAAQMSCCSTSTHNARLNQASCSCERRGCCGPKPQPLTMDVATAAESIAVAQRCATEGPLFFCCARHTTDFLLLLAVRPVLVAKAGRDWAIILITR